MTGRLGVLVQPLSDLGSVTLSPRKRQWQITFKKILPRKLETLAEQLSEVNSHLKEIHRVGQQPRGGLKETTFESEPKVRDNIHSLSGPCLNFSNSFFPLFLTFFPSDTLFCLPPTAD